MPLSFVNRHNTNCLKWDAMRWPFGQSDLIPLWVADMDFRAPDCVVQALQRRVEHGVFGYGLTPPTFFEAFCDWQSRRHGYTPQLEHLRYSPGVMTACNLLIGLMTRPGEKVLVLTPLYDHLLNMPGILGRELVTSELLRQNGVYSIDFDDLSRKLAKPDVTLFLLCSPHNPVGRVWTDAELRTILDLCRKHAVRAISDEIHQDLIPAGHQVPAASVGDYDDMLVTLTAASKTFNLAGLKSSVAVLPDAALRKAYDAQTEGLMIAKGNLLGYVAAEAAWRGGEAWLEEVLLVVRRNHETLVRLVTQAHPKVVASPLEGTYLAWLDFSAYLPDAALADYFQRRCGVGLTYGRCFGPGGEGHVRVNLATDPALVQKAAEAIAAQPLL